MAQEHKMGKHYGYEVDTETGEIFLAPALFERMDTLGRERLALNDLLNSLYAYGDQRLQAILKQENQWWRDVFADLGYGGFPKAAYNSHRHSITFAAEEKAMPPEQAQ